MKRATRLTAALALPAVLLSATFAFAGDDDAPAPLSLERFEELHAELQPDGVEPWQTIPWELDLFRARALAVERGQPLFLWSMNGHPLGCT